MEKGEACKGEQTEKHDDSSFVIIDDKVWIYKKKKMIPKVWTFYKFHILGVCNLLNIKLIGFPQKITLGKPHQCH